MKNALEISADWESLYAEDPESCIQAIWAGYSSTATQKNMTDFAAYLKMHHLQIFEKIYQASLKEFLKRWKNIGSAKSLHQALQNLEQNKWSRRQVLTGGLSSIGLRFLGYTGPDLLTNRIAEIMAAQRINTMTTVGSSPRDDLGSALWKDTLGVECKEKMKKILTRKFAVALPGKLVEIIRIQADDLSTEGLRRSGIDYIGNLSRGGGTIGKITEKMNRVFEGYDDEYREALWKLPFEILMKLDQSRLSKTMNNIEDMISVSLDIALKEEKIHQQEKLENVFSSLKEMESHYHERAILEAWLAAENASNREELKKILTDRARNEFLEKSADWSQRVKNVINTLKRIQLQF